ncbi:MAG: hypothetical protein ACREBS_12160 [Nitrososphaerales archaeon]
MKMQYFLISSTLFVFSSFQIGGLDEKISLQFGLESAAGIFSLILFVVSLYAWSRRGRQISLLIVAVAFLTFFSKQLIEILPIDELHDELFSPIMDFVVLGLFFVALVVRPQRRIEGQQYISESDEH